MAAMEEQAPAARMASSEGFLVNLTSVLLGLCDPFTAPGSPHAAKIDSTYLLSKARLNLAGETRTVRHRGGGGALARPPTPPSASGTTTSAARAPRRARAATRW